MPTIYQSTCDRCSYISDLYSEAYGAIWVDEPRTATGETVVAGAVLHEPTGDARIESIYDPHLVVLAHPGEQMILEQEGYTWLKLAREGRYVFVQRVICDACGHHFDIRKLSIPSGTGCLSTLLVGIVVGIGMGVWLASFWWGLIIAYGLTVCFALLSSVAGRIFLHLKYRERQYSVDGPTACPKCSNKNYSKVTSRRALTCPQCGEKTLHVRMVGIS